VHSAYHVFSFSHLFSELLHSSPGIAEDDALVNAEVSVEVLKASELPVLLLAGHVILIDAGQGELLVLDQNLEGVVHEALS